MHLLSLTWTSGQGKKSAVSRPIHVSNSHNKFGWISSNGLGGDSIKDRYTPGKRQSKTLLTIDEHGSKIALETVFLIAICGQSGDKWQSKTLFLTIFDLHSSIVMTFLTAAYPVWDRRTARGNYINYNISFVIKKRGDNKKWIPAYLV